MRGRFRMLSLALLFAGCEEGAPEHDGGHGGFAESCQAIIDACHDTDPGTGRAHECHETAHDDGTAAACDPIEAECVAACEAFAVDGGAHSDHDAAAHGDGGHAGHDGG